ncbi:hypothetical protein GOP47_0024887 [Adiantum capillus-veneris]|uniref:Uncharacterized protein n=1 Tax=Adiantum capillus-veneris TaxID=13818 RepID=A0A9D4U335_ADICA|nr:hypothetical protein GOP47_0024887 [Adiantum capillus-veneris]
MGLQILRKPIIKNSLYIHGRQKKQKKGPRFSLVFSTILQASGGDIAQAQVSPIKAKGGCGGKGRGLTACWNSKLRTTPRCGTG